MKSEHQGVKQIFQYNWPFYVSAALICGSAVYVLAAWNVGTVLTTLIALGLGITLFWTVASLAVSWYVYDYSVLTKWEWIAGYIPFAPQRWANLHAGADEVHDTLLRLYPDSECDEIDIFDAEIMSEKSIQRARDMRSHLRSAHAVPLSEWTSGDSRWDAAFLIFAAHEIRDGELRLQLFKRIRDELRVGGKLLVVEHLRDVPNFLAFGPGFFHFLPHSEWRRLATDADFTMLRDEKLTPFVRVMLMETRE